MDGQCERADLHECFEPNVNIPYCLQTILIHAKPAQEINDPDNLWGCLEDQKEDLNDGFDVDSDSDDETSYNHPTKSFKMGLLSSQDVKDDKNDVPLSKLKIGGPSYSSTFLFSAATNGVIRVWTLPQERGYEHYVEADLVGHTQRVFDMVFTHKHLISCEKK